MAASVATAPPKRRFTAWLPMAPTTDAESASSQAAPASTSAPTCAVPQTIGYPSSSSAPAPAHQPRHRKRPSVVFELGASDSSDRPSPSSSSRSADSSPTSDFDFRSSFAPMPHYRTGHGHTLERVNGGGGIEFAGREWRGKTAHAVEQEMETLRDENLMSHAPDATYLASRLEGLKRNLEAQGERRPSYVEYEQDLVLDGTVTQADHPEHPDDLSTAPSLPLQSTSAASLSTSLADSSVSNLSASSDWIGSTKMDVDPLSIPSVEPAAKAAALDARIELRPLRRADLEQVRELHCLHGDSDRACNAESYTTSASFLLRLLVDEKHVCIVAVAKPLPVPEPLPSMDTIHARESKPKSPYGPDFGFGDALGPAPQGFGLGGLGLAGGYALSNSSATSSTEDLSSTPTDSLLSSSPRFAHAHGHGRSQSGSNMGALTELTSGTSISTSPPHAGSATGTDKEKDKDKDKPCLLAGPVHLAPPRAVRVMAAPPPRGSRGILLETETIVGVASAHITVAPPAPEETWADLNVPSGSPHGVSDGSFGSTQHRAARSKVPAKEAHILTLSVAPSERGQGLGARLLDELLSEIQSRSSSRGGSPRSLPASASSLTTTFATSSNPPPPSHPTTRAYLEVHPSNTRATSLYASRGFERARGERGTKRGFYRGDERICVAERLKVGGTDAVVLERLF